MVDADAQEACQAQAGQVGSLRQAHAGDEGEEAQDDGGGAEAEQGQLAGGVAVQAQGSIGAQAQACADARVG